MIMTLSQVTFASELTRPLCSLSVAGRAPAGPGLTHEVRVSLSASPCLTLAWARPGDSDSSSVTGKLDTGLARGPRLLDRRPRLVGVTAAGPGPGAESRCRTVALPVAI